MTTLSEILISTALASLVILALLSFTTNVASIQSKDASGTEDMSGYANSSFGRIQNMTAEIEGRLLEVDVEGIAASDDTLQIIKGGYGVLFQVIVDSPAIVTGMVTETAAWLGIPWYIVAILLSIIIIVLGFAVIRAIMKTDL